MLKYVLSWTSIIVIIFHLLRSLGNATLSLHHDSWIARGALALWFGIDRTHSRSNTRRTAVLPLPVRDVI